MFVYMWHYSIQRTRRVLPCIAVEQLNTLHSTRESGRRPDEYVSPAQRESRTLRQPPPQGAYLYKVCVFALMRF